MITNVSACVCVLIQLQLQMSTLVDFTMPVPAVAEPVVDHQKQFQAAVDVIHNLPKNGM